MSFGTGSCGICGKSIRWDDEFCGDLCQAEADRRGEDECDCPPNPSGDHYTDCRLTPDPIEDAVVTAAEFIVRLNIRPTATPDVREAAAIEKLVNFVGTPPRVVSVSVLEDHRRRHENLAEIVRDFDARVRAQDRALASIRAFLLDPDLPDSDSLERVREELADLDPQSFRPHPPPPGAGKLDLCERCGWERGTKDGCCNTGTRTEETCL